MLDLLEQMERRASLVFQDYQVIREDKGQRVRKDSKASLEPMEKREQGE